MKSLKLLVLILLVSNLCKAQDTIFKRNGDKLIAKITEITPQDVKYKRFDFQEGPTYIESKTAIKEIHFSNGLKEFFAEFEVATTPKVPKNIEYGYVAPMTNKKIELYGSRFKYQGSFVHENEIHSILLNTKDKRLINLVGKAKDAKAMQYVGFGGIVFGIASYVFLLKSLGAFSNGSYRRTNSADITTSGMFLAAAVACPIISGVNKGKRNQYNREAVRLYNEKY
jgi:hypothetical protein